MPARGYSRQINRNVKTITGLAKIARTSPIPNSANTTLFTEIQTHIVQDGRRDMTKVCVVCGKKFEAPAKGYYKCCSKECSATRDRERKRAYNKGCVRKKKCKSCGKSFTPTRHFREYCSVPCQMRRVNIPKETLKCLYCGKPLEGGRRKYCSDACQDYGYRGVPIEKIAPKKRISQIDDINTQARGKGLSYGAYKAAQYMKEHIPPIEIK